MLIVVTVLALGLVRMMIPLCGPAASLVLRVREEPVKETIGLVSVASPCVTTCQLSTLPREFRSNPVSSDGNWITDGAFSAQ